MFSGLLASELAFKLACVCVCVKSLRRRHHYHRRRRIHVVVCPIEIELRRSSYTVWFSLVYCKAVQSSKQARAGERVGHLDRFKCGWIAMDSRAFSTRQPIEANENTLTREYN